jgi:hypothetical protein
MPSKSRNQIIIEDIKEYIQDHQDKEELEELLEGTAYATILKRFKLIMEDDGEEDELLKFINETEAKYPKVPKKANLGSDTESESDQSNPKVSESKPKPKKKPTAISVPLANTEDLPWLGETDLGTEKLRELLGSPEPNPDQDPETMDWRYEYKIKVGTKLYSVYDKLNEDDTFDPEDKIEWFANGTGTIKHLMSAMK